MTIAADLWTVGDLLTSDPVTVTSDMSASELAHLLDANEISGVPVVDESDHVIGVVSKTDLLHRCVEALFETGLDSFAILSDSAEAWDPNHLGTIADFMNADPVTARADEPADVVAARLIEYGVHRAVVVDDQRCVVGIVTSMDLLRALVRDPSAW